MTTPQLLNLTLWFYLIPMLFNHAIWWVWEHNIIKGSYASAMWKQRDPNQKRAPMWVRWLPPTVLLVTLLTLLLIALDIVVLTIEAIRPKD